MPIKQGNFNMNSRLSINNKLKKTFSPKSKPSEIIEQKFNYYTNKTPQISKEEDEAQMNIISMG